MGNKAAICCVDGRPFCCCFGVDPEYEPRTTSSSVVTCSKNWGNLAHSQGLFGGYEADEEELRYRLADDDELYEERPEFKALTEEEQMRENLLTAVRRDDAPGVLDYVADCAELVDMGEALRLAAERGSSAVVRELVAVGLTVDASCPHTGFTPLHLAAANGHVSVCELLLEALADVHLPVAFGSGGTTALGLARTKGNLDVEEAIEDHIARLVLPPEPMPECKDLEAPIRTRANVLPRVSPKLSEAVLCQLGVGPLPGAADCSSAFQEGCGTLPGCQLRELLKQGRGRGPELHGASPPHCRPRDCGPTSRRGCWHALSGCCCCCSCRANAASVTYHELVCEQPGGAGSEGGNA